MPNPPLGEQMRFAATRLTRDIRKRPYLWLVATAVAAVALGWGLGSWATCGQQCRFDTNLFSALGSWVGGLATTGAFIFTAHELRSSQDKEEKAKKLQAELTLTKARGLSCKFYGDVSMPAIRPEVQSDLHLRVINETDSPVTDVRVLVGPELEEVASTAQINGKNEGRSRNYWQTPLDLASFGLKPDPFGLMVPAIDDSRYRVEFKMEGHRFRWEGGKVNLADG